MKVFSTIKELQIALEEYHLKNKRIGFIPTMGALHNGHLSLIKKSIIENDITIVSIFVNPTQFNQQKDFETYPRVLENDLKLLSPLGVDFVFAPSEKEIYPEVDKRLFSYPPFTSVMEGEKRPGHFNGVCQIVSKLFKIISPTVAYFGEKDFQQIAVIKAMVRDLNLSLEIKSCPIIREKTGLALSSRNTLLTEEERIIAAEIYKTLEKSREYASSHSVQETLKYVIQTIDAIKELEVEYFKIIDTETFMDINNWNDSKHIQGCITVYCGKQKVRLIDNISYK